MDEKRIPKTAEDEETCVVQGGIMNKEASGITAYCMKCGRRQNLRAALI
jgi:hypothetical protein